MRRSQILIVPVMLLALLLAACGGEPAVATTAPMAPPAAGSELTRTDSQGAVEFEVTPLNLEAPGETLDFDVSLNTHSVELNWDLAALSTLTTNTGREVAGTSWPGGSGHHVEGVLSFPAQTAAGEGLLEGASRLILVIRNAGAPERTFEWGLPG